MAQPFKALHTISFRRLCQFRDLIKPVANQDFLLQNLKSATNTNHVFSLVKDHYNIMNSKHSIQALRSIFELQKSGNTSLSMKDIMSHPAFDKLCRRLKSHAGVIEVNETIEALKVISYIGVPSNSIIVQTLLQLIRHNLNNMSLNHIVFLEFLLRQFKPTPLIEALKLALPIVFEVNLPVKIDRTNLAHLTEFLHYASSVELSDNTYDCIIGALSEYRDDFDSKTAKSIIWSLCALKPSYALEPLLNRAMNDMIVHMDELSFNDVSTTLSKLTYNYNSKFEFYYNEVFVDACLNYVVSHDVGYSNALLMIRYATRLNHHSSKCLDYIAEKIKENPSLLSEGNPIDIFRIVSAVALTDYRPKHWDFVKDSIAKTKISSNVEKNFLWIKFGASLSLLGIYKIDVLSKCLQLEYLQRLFRQKFMSDLENYFSIWQSINLYKKELVDLIPAEFEPEKMIGQFKPVTEFPLLGALEKGLGGEEYLLSNLFTKSGHQIDHVLQFRKGGFPVPLSGVEATFLEDLDQSSEIQTVVVFLLKPLFFTKNTKVMKLSTSLAMKYLELEGYKVVPISLEVWESLNDFEKVPYIMQRIKSQLDLDNKLHESNAL